MFFLFFMLSGPPDKPVTPPANPCSNPVKCPGYPAGQYRPRPDRWGDLRGRK